METRARKKVRTLKQPAKARSTPQATPLEAPPSLDSCESEDSNMADQWVGPEAPQPQPEPEPSTSELQATPAINEPLKIVDEPPDFIQEVEIVASAPPDSEPAMKQIYPDLPAVDGVVVQAMELEVENVLETSLPAPLTLEKKKELFEPTSDAELKAMEATFVAREKYNTPAIYNNETNLLTIYSALSEYSRQHHLLTGSLVEKRKDIQLKLSHLKEDLWTFEERSFEATGVCADGNHVTVTAKRKIATLREERGKLAMEELSRALDKKIAEEKEASMRCQFLRYDLETCFVECAQKPTMMAYLSLLAYVLRREERSSTCVGSNSCTVRFDLRKWFRCIAARLEAGATQDQLDVLHHLLRFPGGIGDWATDLVQPLSAARLDTLTRDQDSSMTDSEVRCVLTLLNAIMHPITARNEFIHTGLADDGGDLDEFAWVDSDGESDDPMSHRELVPLTENDMTAMLNQLPFEQLFRTLRNAMQPGDVYKWLYGIVLADTLVHTLCNGCRTYASKQRYRNFIKRLGLLINHTVGYVDDAMRLLPTALSEPPQLEMRARVQVEYDAFIYHTARRIYEVRTVGLWQYLTQLPFEHLSKRALWGLYGAIRAGEFSERCPTFTPDDSNVSLRSKMLSFRDNDECYYTLQMLGYMVQARKDDAQFVRVVILNFLELLVMMNATEQIKGEYVVDRLRDLVAQHPATISALLNTVEGYRNATEDGKLVPPPTEAHLLKIFHHNYLPLARWTPGEADIDLLLRWFTPHGHSAPRFHVLIASELLTHIHYEKGSNQVVVPREWQLKIARIVANSHSSALVSPPGTVDGAHNAAHDLSTKGCQTRCIIILQQLRVHAMDQSTASVQRAVLVPEKSLGQGFVNDSRDEPLLHFGLRMGCPVASLAALLITTSGHWAPLVFQEGIALVRKVASYNTVAAVRCLELIVPLMVCPDVGLAKHELFLQLVGDLLKGDHAARQKSDVGPLQAMMVAQISQYRRYGFASPAVLVKFWTETILGAHSNVPVNEVALRALNHLAYISIGVSDAWAAMRNLLAPLFKEPELVKPAKSCLNQIIQKIIPSEPLSMYTNMPLDHVPLALLVFEAEHLLLEVQTGLWPQLLRLLNSERTITLDEALGRVCSSLGLKHCPPGSMLVLYKQGRLLTRLDCHHPLYPLLCQQFFSVLLTRPPSAAADGLGAYAFGLKDRLLKADWGLAMKLQTSFCLAERHYANLPQDARPGPESNRGPRQPTNGELRSTFKAFTKWILDKKMDALTVDELDRLPEDVYGWRLVQACRGLQESDIRSCWLHAHWGDQQEVQRKATEQWTRTFRCVSQWSKPPPDTATVAPRSLEPAGPRRLQTYPKPKPLAVVIMPETPDIVAALWMAYDRRANRVVSSLQKIDEYTERRYRPTITEFGRLKKEIFDKTTRLYENSSRLEREGAKCGLFCTGEAFVTVRVQVAEEMSHVADQLEGYRRDFASTVEAAIYLPPHIMQHIVMVKLLWGSFFPEIRPQQQPALEECHRFHRASMLLDAVCGMLRANCADHMKYAVEDMLKRSFAATTHPLGYAAAVQFLRSACLQKKLPPDILLDAIDPYAMSPKMMAHTYGLLTGLHQPIERALFVRLFAGKFDMVAWLRQANPEEEYFSEIFQFISETAGTESYVFGNVSTEVNEKFFEVLVAHMVALAHYQFPDNFCKLLYVMLFTVCKKNPLPPITLLALVNPLYERLNLPPLTLGMDGAAVRQALRRFALANNNVPAQQWNLELTVQMQEMIGGYFNRFRCDLGSLTALYQHHQSRIEELSLVLGTVAHAFVLHDRIGYCGSLDVRLPYMFRLFEAWVVPFSLSQANCTDGWTTDCDSSLSRIIETMLQAIESAIDRFGASGADIVLSQVLEWYILSYNNAELMPVVLAQVHKHLLMLPWELLLPRHHVLVCFRNALQRCIPECHQVIGAVFLRCRWAEDDGAWIDADPQHSGATTRAMLLLLCVQLALEPVIRNCPHASEQMVAVLSSVSRLPWHQLTFVGLEPAIDWYTLTADASAVLRSPTSPHAALDEMTLHLLEIAAQYTANEANPLRAGSLETCKRALLIRTIVRQLGQVIASPNRTSAAGPVKQLTEYAVRRMFLNIGNVLETSLAGESLLQDRYETRLHDARSMLTAVVLGINRPAGVHCVFILEAIRVVQVRSRSSVALAQTLLEVTKLFTAQSCKHLLQLVDTALFAFLDTGDNGHGGEPSSWMRALEAVGCNTVRRWQPDGLVQNGNLFCLQLYFLGHWWNPTDTSVPRPELLRQVLGLLKTSKKEANELHLYPLWLTMVFAVFNLGPQTPKKTMHSLVEGIGEYLLRISEQGQRSWIVEMVQALMTAKKTPSATHRVIALGLNCCISAAYRTLLAPEGDEDAEADGTESGAAGSDADDDASSEDDVVASSTILMLADPAQAFRPLLNDPNMAEHREQIEKLTTELQAASPLTVDATVQLAQSTIERFDRRAVHFLRTLVQALRTDPSAASS